VVMPSKKTILLFGMPRSGTTWLGKLFDANRQTYYLHEPDSVQPNFEIPLLLHPEKSVDSPLAAELPLWFASTAEKVIASRPFFAKNYLNSFSWLLFLSSAYATKAAGKLGLNKLIRPLRIQPPGQRIVWKSIESLGRMAAIKRHIAAHSIHIMRHPCGHIASTLKGQDAGLFDSSLPVWEDWDIYEKLLEQSGEVRFTLADIKLMSKEQRLALRWGIINDFALTQGQYDTDNMVLLYRDLCKEPEETLQKCMAFCDLGADSQTLNYLQQSIQGGDNSYYGTQKDPLVSVYKWQKQLSKDVQQQIKAIIMQFNAGKFYRDDF
jgi:hypothetical protein